MYLKTKHYYLLSICFFQGLNRKERTTVVSFEENHLQYPNCLYKKTRNRIYS